MGLKLSDARQVILRDAARPGRPRRLLRPGYEPLKMEQLKTL